MESMRSLVWSRIYGKNLKDMAGLWLCLVAPFAEQLYYH